MLVAAALVGLAVALQVRRSSAVARLGVVLPREPDVRAPGRDQETMWRVATALAGLAFFLLVGGVPGLLLAGGVFAAGQRFATWHLARASASDEADDVPLPLVLDLLAACLRGGASLPHAVGAVAAVTPGTLGGRLARVEASLLVGASPEDAFSALGEDGAAAAAARTLRRALEGGTPVAAAVGRVAEEARRGATVAAEKRAKTVAVKVLVPLGACFLPAFFLLGVVPPVIAIGSSLVSDLG